MNGTPLFKNMCATARAHAFGKWSKDSEGGYVHNARGQRKIAYGKRVAGYVPEKFRDAHLGADGSDPSVLIAVDLEGTDKVIFDIDDHDGDNDQLMRDAAKVFAQFGDAVTVTRSGGGRGLHACVTFENKITLEQARNVAHHVAIKCAKSLGRPFKIGTGSFANGEIDYYPKSTNSLIAAPGARESCLMIIADDVYVPSDDEPLMPADVNDAFLNPPKRIANEPDKIDPTDDMRDMIECAAKEHDLAAADREPWYTFAHHVKSVFADDGFDDFARVCQAAYPSCTIDMQKKLWDGIKVERISPNTKHCLLRDACKHGYGGVLRWNDTHFMLLESSRIDVVRDDDEMKTSSLPTFLTFHEPSDPVVRKWAKHPLARRYEQVTWDPDYKGDSKYNLWKGLQIDAVEGTAVQIPRAATEPLRESTWPRFESHIRNVLCPGQDADYFINALAWRFQNLGQLPKVAFVFRGDPGTGKSIVADFLVEILGEACQQFERGGQLTGRFNDHLERVLIGFVEEALWGGDKEGKGVLKAMITQDRMNYEAKYRSIWRGTNRAMLLFFSNENWVVPVDLGDRRFAVYDTGRKPPKEYFRGPNGLVNAIKEEAPAFLHAMLTRDLSGFDITEVPWSDAKHTQMEHTESPTHIVLRDVLTRGALPETTDTASMNDKKPNMCKGSAFADAVNHATPGRYGTSNRDRSDTLKKAGVKFGIESWPSQCESGVSPRTRVLVFDRDLRAAQLAFDPNHDWSDAETTWSHSYTDTQVERKARRWPD